MIVRDYRAEDEAAVRGLFDELVEAHRAFYPDGDVGTNFELEGRIFVAEDEGRLVGYAGMIRHPRSAELEPIVVSQDYRGRGVGRALVERVAEEARASGANRLYARPVGRNRDAHAFFHSVGLDVMGYLYVQLDLEPRERRPGETIAGREFRV